MSGQLGPDAGPLVVVHTPDEEVRELAVAVFVLFDLVSKLVGTADAQLRRRYVGQVIDQLDYLAAEAWDVKAWAEVMLLAPPSMGDGPSAVSSSPDGADQAAGEAP